MIWKQQKSPPRWKHYKLHILAKIVPKWAIWMRHRHLLPETDPKSIDINTNWALIWLAWDSKVTSIVEHLSVGTYCIWPIRYFWYGATMKAFWLYAGTSGAVHVKVSATTNILYRTTGTIGLCGHRRQSRTAKREGDLAISGDFCTFSFWNQTGSVLFFFFNLYTSHS